VSEPFYQSVPFTNKVVSSKTVHGEVYSIQYYVIKFVSDLLQIGGFLVVLGVSFTNKSDRHNIAEIMLKVALNTINQPTNHFIVGLYFRIMIILSKLKRGLQIRIMKTKGRAEFTPPPPPPVFFTVGSVFLLFSFLCCPIMRL
jgi:hypothetical protein